MTVEKELWRRHFDEDIWLFTLSSDHVSVRLSNLGCTLVSMIVSKNDQIRDLILGYRTAEEYLDDRYYMGSLVGRFAGRIAGSVVTAGDCVYPLTQNDGFTGNHIHGGQCGFNKKIFSVEQTFADEDEAGISFFYRSPHLEEGYPGNIGVAVSVALTGNDEIRIRYEVQTDSPTFINLTHHCYFNLTGGKDGLQQNLNVQADRFLPLGLNYIPTGEIAAVHQTRFDFMNGGNESLSGQFNAFSGYNDYLVFSPSSDGPPRIVLSDPESGIALQVGTTCPGVLLYTGDYLDLPFIKNEGVCLETQLYPDSPNHPGFPSALLAPGQKYQQETIYTLRNIR